MSRSNLRVFCLMVFLSASISSLSGKTPVISNAFAAQTETERPSPRLGHELIYHKQLKKVVLLNGFGPDLGGLDCPANCKEARKMWAWDGKQWSLIDREAPESRGLAGGVYDPRRNRLVIYGGARSPTRKFDETWVWDEKTWKRFDGAKWMRVDVP